MTPAGELLRDEIRRNGPIPFDRFMEVALYHPEHGYYRRHHPDPFGRAGDFYTAAQMQPVFGVLIAARIRALRREMGDPADFKVVELGAGRGEMAGALAEFNYHAVDIDRGALPDRLRGVVFSNEFFDALPVCRIVWRDALPRECRVAWSGDRFVWSEGDPPGDDVLGYIEKYLPPTIERRSAEVNLNAQRWMERISRSLAAGYVFTIDYGYTTAESVRFPDGTLMSYRRHSASEDVLVDAGLRDITSHVCFPALQAAPALETVSFETLGRTLLAAGEADQFQEALSAGDEALSAGDEALSAGDEALSAGDEAMRRLQLKTLLFGMGEMFRTLLQRKEQ